MGAVTIKNVAALAGVSPATVSRFINQPEVVRPELAERISRAMRGSGYVYNALAGDLSRRRSSAVAVFLPMSEGLGFAPTLFSIQELCLARNLPIMVGSTFFDSRLEAELLRQTLQRRPAGVLLAGCTMANEPLLQEISDQGIPCVLMWEHRQDLAVSTVGMDNFAVARRATEYLLDLGHRRIGLIVGPASVARRPLLRLEGYKAALSARRIPFDPDLVLERKPLLLDGHEAMGRFLALPEPPTAVFGAADALALGAIAAVRRNGLRVPDDISVIGFDDIEYAAYSDPPLTTMHVQAHRMGKIAMRLLLEMIESKNRTPRNYVIEAAMVVRETCARLP